MTSKLPALFRNASLMLGIAATAASAAFNFFNPSKPDSIPKLISGTGMYKNMATKELTPDIVAFDVNAPLWTDGAVKQRYIAVPPGTSVIYSDTADLYKYPEGAVVIKNFSVDTIPGNPASRILFETRFVGMRKIAGKEKWFLWSYHWRLDQTDADLVPDSGQDATVRVYRNGTAAAPFMKKWRFPGKVQCAACHRIQTSDGRNVLAFFTAQLNRPWSGNASINQLQHFFDIGLLKSEVGAAAPDFAAAPKWARWDDTTASLDLRARSYLAGNCSGCHGTRGLLTNATLNVTLDYDYHDMKPHMDFLAKKLIGVFPLDSAALIVPGRPDRSVLLYRQKMRNQKDLDFTAERMAMPPLGSFEPDTNAINLISKWIVAMGPASIDGAIAAHGMGGAAQLRNGRIHLSEAWMGGGAGTLVLMDLQGKSIPLERIDARTYRIAGKIGAGMHLLLWNGRPAAKLML
ncbi:MAG: hypothetical protein JWP91_2597 [Fibrobacteres bacterium]|nr:hypothetical protein [Fibrobacterota bacterium]